MTENEKKLKEIDDLLTLREELRKKVEEEKKEQERLQFEKEKEEYQKQLKEQQEKNKKRYEEELKERERQEQEYLKQAKEREKAHSEYMRENGYKHWKLTTPITNYLRNYKYIRYGIHYTPDLDDPHINLARKELVKELNAIQNDVIQYLSKEQIKKINSDIGFKAIKEPWF